MKKPKIVVCASGGGSNFEAIVTASRAGHLQAEVIGLLCNRPRIGALARAARLNVPAVILQPRDFVRTKGEWDQTVAEQLREWHADWIVLAGFLALVGPTVLTQHRGRVVNSHPSLLPKFGGPGMYGDNVHAAVLAAGEVESGVTVHLVDAEYDRGVILAQQRVPVLPTDTVASLAARVKGREVEFYPRVLNDLVTGRITTS